MPAKNLEASGDLGRAPRARSSSVDPFAVTLPATGETKPTPSSAAKTAVVIKSATARAQGLRGVFLTLAQQHAEAAALLAALETTEDPHARRESWTRLRVALLSHERAETEVVYSTLQRFGLTQPLAGEHEHAAAKLEELIGTVQRLDPSDPLFLAEVARLASYVRSHAEEEENVWFPAAQAILTDGRLEQLETTFLETQGLVRAEL
ncbi:MAG: hemerythrin domain-containing protein [Myxococcales bacterium]